MPADNTRKRDPEGNLPHLSANFKSARLDADDQAHPGRYESQYGHGHSHGHGQGRGQFSSADQPAYSVHPARRSSHAHAMAYSQPAAPALQRVSPTHSYADVRSRDLAQLGVGMRQQLGHAMDPHEILSAGMDPDAPFDFNGVQTVNTFGGPTGFGHGYLPPHQALQPMQAQQSPQPYHSQQTHQSPQSYHAQPTLESPQSYFSRQTHQSPQSYQSHVYPAPQFYGSQGLEETLSHQTEGRERDGFPTAALFEAIVNECVSCSSLVGPC